MHTPKPALYAHALLAALALAACTGPGAPGLDAATDAPAVTDARDTDAPVTRALAVATVQDLGAFSVPSPTVIGRDGVSSGQLGTRLVWTFGDTFLGHETPDDHTSVRSATGGWSTVDAPLTLAEPVDDAGVPNQLIPYTADELAQNRADALNGWALWPGAVLDTGGDQLLVLFQRIKRSGGSGFDGVGLGTARLAAGATVATRAPADLFCQPLADAGSAGCDPTPLYGSAGVATPGDGFAYFFACGLEAPLLGGCGVARAPLAQADQRTAFRFYDGHAWGADPSAVVPVIYGIAGGFSLTYNPYLGSYLAVNSVPFSNDVRLRTAPHIEGPWTSAGVTVHAADGGIMAAPMDMTLYLAQEHVALRSADGRQLVVSYARPLGNFRGEVRLARITLE